MNKMNKYKINNIALAINPNKKKAGEIINKVREYFWGVNFYLEEETARALNLGELGKPAEVIRDYVQLCFALGGDGTLLYAARLLDYKIPLLGINTGSSLGFLTTISFDELGRHVEDILNYNFGHEERLLLQVGVFQNGELIKNYYSLNEALIIRDISAKIIRLRLFVNEVYLTSLYGDGVIVATPSGSTGYSLSSGGPILSPNVEAFIITGVCVHAISNLAHSIILGKHDILKIKLTEDEYMTKQEDTFLFIDGQKEHKFKTSEYIIISRTDKTARLVKLPETQDFYSILRTKLKI